MVWGGDFNHALIGGELSGSRAGRGHIEDLVRDLGLQVPTSVLPHRLDGAFSIDHVAVPKDAVVRGVSRHDATGLSDHDAYVVALA